MKRAGLYTFVAVVLLPISISAQNDGDHSITDGIGRSYFAPDLQVGGGIVNPINLNVSLNPYSLATLNVRADELPINDPITPSGAGGATVLGSFRTDVGSSVWQTWRMMCSSNQIGLLYGRGDHRAFHIQAPSIGDVG